MHDDQGDAPTFDETPVAGSSLDELAQMREQMMAERTEVFELPGYGGRLWARYRALDWDEQAKLEVDAAKAAKGDKNLRAHLHMQIRAIASACEEILFNNDPSAPTPDLVPFAQHIGLQGTVRYDPILAANVGKGRTSDGPQSVVHMFPRETVISAHYQELKAWMDEVNPDVDEQMRGESAAAAR